MFATGRRPASARRGLDPLGFAGPLVTMNGAVGTDVPGGREWHRRAFSAEEAATLWRSLDAARLRPVVYVCDANTDVVIPAHCATSPAHLAGFARPVPADPRAPMAAGTVIAFALCGIDGDAWARAESVAHALASQASVHLGPDATFGGGWLAIAPKAVTKRTAVERWCIARGIAASEVLAVGDGGNDEALLAWAGVSVAVRGSACARAGADHVIPPPDEGGWAQLLELR